ncbi:hypothetical protein L198_04272 [Cryptococcus wingfieldii CBS 7118]|uniref:Uncharacterized protein n=1 Tax=Cryptococcus wingfieldii CBS 7118 TaxID=1295528 RepID=A0A1E3J6R7_9TREE|nr:hypothetical protein L198_04272 [Cryptococcus wingfieldii CBS 7118]ODN96557.1 hypothetical protein L198_04272 [Cryptococcus wingfieldii CBS 7118]
MLRRHIARLSPTPTPTPFTRSYSAPTPPGPPPKPPTPSLLDRYTPYLTSLSQRTGVPLPSLGLSFLALHELTAILPVLGFYYLFASFGVGAGLVVWVSEVGHEEEKEGWKRWVKEWYEEGVAKVDRVGRRYGVLEYEKQEHKVEGSGETAVDSVKTGGAKAAEKVADAVAAYVLVKALLPARIGLSLVAAPAFARYTLVPLQNLFRRQR